MFLILDMLNNHRFCTASETGAWALYRSTVRNIIPTLNNATKTKKKIPDDVVFWFTLNMWNSNNL